MDVTSLKFGFFVAVAAIVVNVLPLRHRSYAIALASLVFVAVFDLVAAATLALCTGLVFVVGRKISDPAAPKRRSWFAGTVAFLVLNLVVIKALALAPHLASARTIFGRGVGELVPAFGVSYYTFRLVGYLIDVYWERYPACISWADFIAFAAFFPQISAGPIQRADAFPGVGPVREEEALPPLRARVPEALRRILYGLFKKVVVADQLGGLVDYVGGSHHAELVWMIPYLFTVQLFADFSALSDIAIGVSALLGVKSAENFDHPFFVTNIGAFWRRWHMSLTSWLSDYVFTPLRMALRSLGSFGAGLAIVTNMILIGAWHGFNVGCVLFGFLNGLLLTADALSSARRRKLYRAHRWLDRATTLLGPVFVFHWIAFTLTIFWAGSYENVRYVMANLFDGAFHPLGALHLLFFTYGRGRCFSAALALAALIVAELVRFGRVTIPKRLEWLPDVTRLPVPLRWGVYYGALLWMAIVRQQSTGFIYVRF
jgi:D-alanyl-lipoteichoic acid acyltransferase DltB (MBOAT superfamily)